MERIHAHVRRFYLIKGDLLRIDYLLDSVPKSPTTVQGAAEIYGKEELVEMYTACVYGVEQGHPIDLVEQEPVEPAKEISKPGPYLAEFEREHTIVEVVTE
ncbi:hypothetical protein CRG98_028510 [Punica granatum]|uniref:Uncharacterized protein n=1 Tax=Punica granatum TaxID=22663 RepID=A0A2I0J4C2_PUNGR|nr:hypothetical protein CRG98_028510 [Punica granatum]